MALPVSLHASMSPFELEFIASEHLIFIEPLFRMDQIRLVSVRYLWPISSAFEDARAAMAGPIAETEEKVPYICPRLAYKNLQERLREETRLAGFSKLPFRFAEIAKVLLDVAADDLIAPERLRMLLKDLREARQAKSREGLQRIDHFQMALPNLCSMEINEIRPFFVQAMNVVGKLTVELPGEEGANDEYAFEEDQEEMRAMDRSSAAPVASRASRALTSEPSSHPTTSGASTRWGTGEWGR